MESINSHLITCFVLVLIPCVASLSFDLNFVGTRNQTTEANIQFDGAYISEDGIHLTPDQLSSNQGQVTGRVTYYKPFRLYDTRSNGLASFSTNFTFVIDSNGNANYSYGLTFFLAESNSLVQPDGDMGLPMANSSSSLRFRFVAVEFDTFWDQWDPKYSNGTHIGDHVGISISSRESDKYKKWLSNVTGGGVCQASVRYDSAFKNFSVSFTGWQNNTVELDGFSDTIDLKKELPQWVIFGFSAATSGSRLQKNILRSWSFESSGLDQNPHPTVYGKRNKAIDISIVQRSCLTGSLLERFFPILPLAISFTQLMNRWYHFVLWRNVSGISNCHEELWERKMPKLQSRMKFEQMNICLD